MPLRPAPSHERRERAADEEVGERARRVEAPVALRALRVPQRDPATLDARLVIEHAFVDRAELLDAQVVVGDALAPDRPVSSSSATAARGRPSRRPARRDSASGVHGPGANRRPLNGGHAQEPARQPAMREARNRLDRLPEAVRLATRLSTSGRSASIV